MAEARSPDRERLGVVLSKEPLADQRHLHAFAERAQDIRRRQHPARKDVSLDEVHAPPVAVKELVTDGDRLDAGKTARLEPLMQLIEVGRPERLADGLDHLDRGDTVELPVLIAVILQPDLDFFAEAGFLDSPAGEFGLLIADGKRQALGAASFGGIFAKAAPAAADLKQGMAGPQLDR